MLLRGGRATGGQEEQGRAGSAQEGRATTATRARMGAPTGIRLQKRARQSMTTQLGGKCVEGTKCEETRLEGKAGRALVEGGARVMASGDVSLRVAAPGVVAGGAVRRAHAHAAVARERRPVARLAAEDDARARGSWCSRDPRRSRRSRRTSRAPRSCRCTRLRV